MPPDNLHADLLDNLTTAVLLLDEEQQITYINQAAEALLETSGQRILGTPLSRLFFEAEGTVEQLERARKEGNSYTKRKTRLTLHSGRQVTVDYVITPLAITGASLLVEIQPLDRLLRINREETLLASHQTAKMLVRGLAHEIKNPLGGIRGAAQLLARELPRAELNDYTRVIIDEADRLGSLVDRMLNAPKIVRLDPLNIHQVLERVRQLGEAECEGAIEFRRDYDPSIPDISGDSEQLIQAVLNIVRNAMQALEGAAETVERPCIELQTRTLRQFTIGSRYHRLVCHIRISDNGPGVPEELTENLFFPMVSGRAEGTGLGLAVAQSVVNQHQGLIEYEREAGRTSFSIYLPFEHNNGANHD
jgi:two-component system nitrogen regulation sensor histidine kinase GlnL